MGKGEKTITHIQPHKNMHNTKKDKMQQQYANKTAIYKPKHYET